MGTPSVGYVSFLSIDAVEIGGLQDCTLDIQVAQIDVTDKDSAGWDEFIAGQGSGSISGTCVYEEDDAGQEDIIDAILAKTVAAVIWRPLGTGSGNDEWTCNGFFTSMQISSPNKEALSFPFSIQLTGTPARAAQ